MKESINNNKILIISHIADVDGISSVILARLHCKDIDFCLVEFSELEGLLQKLIIEDRVKEYDEIFITDLSIRPSTLELINNH
jgi:single-stranded DNA-specific DHH superfamily exonuclease